MSSNKRDNYIVFGGSGFVGRHIVEQLLARGDTVSVFDIVQKYHDTPFYTGDITEEEQVADALRKVRCSILWRVYSLNRLFQSGATCIFHTVSPPHGMQDPALYWKVNVDGTRAIVSAAQSQGVRKLVFTSSAGLIFNGGDLINVDERSKAPEKAMDAYNESKKEAEEMVLAANGQKGLLTVSLRPAGIFGYVPDTDTFHGLLTNFYSVVPAIGKVSQASLTSGNGAKHTGKSAITPTCLTGHMSAMSPMLTFWLLINSTSSLLPKGL